MSIFSEVIRIASLQWCAAIRVILTGFIVTVVAADSGGIAHAQQTSGEPQHLESESLVIITSRGRFDLNVEIADDPGEQAKGLMFREDLDTKEGMLFDFGETRPVSMWMKNTPLSLDMVFIRDDGTVARVAERTEPYSLDIIPSEEPVAFVLELRAGVANLIGLKPGDHLEHRLFAR